MTAQKMETDDGNDATTKQLLAEMARGKIKFLEEQLNSANIREYGHCFRPPNWRRKATRALKRERERLALLIEAMKGLIHKKKEHACRTCIFSVDIGDDTILCSRGACDLPRVNPQCQKSYTHGINPTEFSDWVCPEWTSFVKN